MQRCQEFEHSLGSTWHSCNQFSALLAGNSHLRSVLSVPEAAVLCAAFTSLMPGVKQHGAGKKNTYLHFLRGKCEASQSE